MESTDVHIMDVPEVSLERTLAIVKPKAVKHLQDIIDAINSNGYEIIQKRIVTLTLEQASEFYTSQEGLPSFPLLVTYMSSGPIVAMCLMGRDAVNGWLNLLGPEDPAEAHQYFPFSLRACFSDPDLEFENALHGSLTPEQAVKEIHFFFPEMIVEPLLSGSALRSYLAESVNPTLLEGLAELCKVKPVDPVVWLADWLLLNNPNKPTVDNPAILAVM